MEMKPNWLGDGKRNGVRIDLDADGKSARFLRDDHPDVIAYLRQQNKTLEQWLAANPAPAAPVKTVAERRRDAYAAAWTNDEFQEAVLEHLSGKPEKLSALNAKRNEIRERIK